MPQFDTLFEDAAEAPQSGAAPSPRPGATPPTLTPATVLARALDAAPFGVEIAAAGTTVYANPAQAASRPREADEQTIRARQFEIALDGECYSLSLTLDETEQCRIERDLIQRAYFDELTGLPNRSLIERSVNALTGPGSAPFALVFIDLDGFKQINDYYGHAVGDRLLAKLAERLSTGLRPSDLLARLSGDEFVLLVSPIGDVETLSRDVEWVSERIKEPFFVEGHEIFTSASIGVSLYPSHGHDYDELLSNADRAMYRGKNGVKGQIRFFDASIEHAAAERTRLEQRLRLAIRDKRVCCAYQPKVDLRTGEVSGVEVLMRWRDEDGMIQAPGEFLSLAIELGLMDDLTHFILAETIAAIDRINDAFGRHCSISVNVAARQVGDYEFMRTLTEALEASGFASRFMLELTEEAFLSKAEFQTRILPMVRATGARVSIDDFGIGYSSLSALADITADEVKVDRSFITEVHRRPRSQSILKAIEALGHSLGMSIVVEGVETFEEVAYLQAATRITCAQGYYFSRPMLLEDLPAGSGQGVALRSTEGGRDTGRSRIAEQRVGALSRAS